MAINITKPTVNGSSGTWGTQLNDALDVIVDGVNDSAAALNPVTITASYTANPGDLVIASPSTANISVTLPSTAPIGSVVGVRRLNDSSFSLNVVGTFTDASASKTLTSGFPGFTYIKTLANNGWVQSGQMNGLRWRGVFASIMYYAGDVVSYLGFTWQLVVTNSSSAPTHNGTQWTKLGPMSSVATVSNTAGFTATANQTILVDATAQSVVTITLPTAQMTGATVTVKKTDASVNPVVVTSQLIDITANLTAKGQAVTYIAGDSANTWHQTATSSGTASSTGPAQMHQGAAYWYTNNAGYSVSSNTQTAVVGQTYFIPFWVPADTNINQGAVAVSTVTTAASVNARLYGSDSTGRPGAALAAAVALASVGTVGYSGEALFNPGTVALKSGWNYLGVAVISGAFPFRSWTPPGLYSPLANSSLLSSLAFPTFMTHASTTMPASAPTNSSFAWGMVPAIWWRTA